MIDRRRFGASRATGCAFAFALLPAASVDAAAPEIDISYVHPERFTDLNGGDARRAATLELLKQHLEQRAAARIGRDRTLRIEITDIDMAGAIEARSARLSGVRVMRDGYPARIELRFRLANEAGATVREGRRELGNPALLGRSDLRPGDPLRYEKALLDDWLEREFPPS